MARINGVHHISISVPSLETAREFYQGVLGFEEAMTFEWRESSFMDTLTGLGETAGRMMFLRAGNLMLEFFEYETPTQDGPDQTRPVHRYGYTHLCLDVDDTAAIHDELSRRGMRFLSAPIVSDQGGTVYGRDPFGNIIELQQIKSDAIPTTLPRVKS